MKYAPLAAMLILLVVLPPLVSFVTAQALDFTIDLLVPAKNSYSVGEAPRLWARVLNTGSAAIDAYDLEGRFSVVSPSGVAIDVGMDSSTMSMSPGAISVIENTDNPWTIPNGAEAGMYTLKVTINSRSTGVSHSGQLDNAFSVNAPPAADFTLSISPSSQTVTAGESTTFTVSVNPQSGWAAPVSLQVSGLPSDATSYFDPNPVQPGGSSRLSISTSRSTGQFGLVVVGNGQGRQHTTSASLIIQASQQGQFDFSIDLLVPAKNSYDVGETPELWARVLNSGSVTIAAYDLDAQFSVVSSSGVTIAAGGGQNGYDIPSGGVRVIENTDNPWTIPSNAEPGLYALRVTINSRSSGLSRSQQLDNAFSISAPPACDFTLSISPTSQLVKAGQQTEFIVTVNSPCGWSEPVSLDVSGFPSDATATLSSNPVTVGQSSNLAVATSGTTTGQFSIVILGNSAGRQHTTTATLIIQPNQPGGFEFSISSSESSTTIEVGKSADVCTVNVELISGSPGRVDVFLTGLPSNIGTYAFSPPYGDPTFTSTLSIGIFDGATPGVYSLTITGNGGGETHSTSFTLTVSGQPTGFDFSISVSPDSGSVDAGETLTPAGTVFLKLLTGSTQSVSLSVSGFPPSVGTEDLTGRSCSPDCQIELGIGTYSGASVGTYTLTITGTGGGKTHSTAFTLTVIGQPSQKDNAAIVAFDPPTGDFNRGDTLIARVTVRNTGSKTRTFWVGLSYQKPDGSYYDLPAQQASTLSPQQEWLLIFRWNLPKDAPSGQYGAVAAVWNGYDQQSNRMVQPCYDQKRMGSSFTVAVVPAESGATFIPDKNDPTAGTLQILNPDGSVKETVRLKKVTIQVMYSATDIPEGSLHVYAYLPISFLPCLAEAVNPIPLTLQDMEKAGEYLLSTTVVEALTGVAVPIDEIDTGLQIIDCVSGRHRVPIGSHWEFDKPQEFYFALDNNAHLQAIFKHLSKGGGISGIYVITEAGNWMGSIAASTNQITITIARDGIEISGGSSIGLMVVDPTGKRVGALVQDSEWLVVQEIPEAYYSGLGSHPQSIVIPNPRDGSYRVLVTGNQTGDYHLNATLTKDAAVVSVQTLSGNVAQGATQEHQVLSVSDEGQAIADPSTVTVLWYTQRPLLFGALLIPLAVASAVFYERTRRRRSQQALVTIRRTCPTCGFINKPTAVFCTRDGTRLSRMTMPTRPVTLHRTNVCSKCGYMNRPTARFCVRDGTRLATALRSQSATRVCPSCGFTNRPTARFCVRDRTPLPFTVTTSRAATTQPRISVLCTKCGTRNRTGALYCRHCRCALR